MSFSEERQKRLEFGYGDEPVTEYLDENVEDEVVSDVVYFGTQSNNEIKIKELMKDLNCIKVRQSNFIECLYYVQKSKSKSKSVTIFEIL